MIAVELYTISMVSALLPVAGMFVILNSASITRNLTWEVSEFVGLG